MMWLLFLALRLLLMWTIFKVFIEFVKYCLCLLFWLFGREAGGILAFQPGIEPVPPPLEGEVLTIGLPGKFPMMCLLWSLIFSWKSLFSVVWKA